MRIVYFSPALDNILTPGKTIAAQVNPRYASVWQGKASLLLIHYPCILNKSPSFTLGRNRK